MNLTEVTLKPSRKRRGKDPWFEVGNSFFADEFLGREPKTKAAAKAAALRLTV